MQPVPAMPYFRANSQRFEPWTPALTRQRPTVQPPYQARKVLPAATTRGLRGHHAACEAVSITAPVTDSVCVSNYCLGR